MAVNCDSMHMKPTSAWANLYDKQLQTCTFVPFVVVDVCLFICFRVVDIGIMRPTEELSSLFVDTSETVRGDSRLACVVKMTFRTVSVDHLHALQPILTFP